MQAWKFWPTHWAGGYRTKDDKFNRIRILTADTEDIVAYVEHHGPGDGEHACPTEEDYKTARKMAAAQELLQACQAFIDCFGNHAPMSVAEWFEKPAAIAQAAIAKALGAESPAGKFQLDPTAPTVRN